MAKQKINQDQMSGIVLFQQGTDLNPLPLTTPSDVPNSSQTFTLNSASSLYITWGCNMQINVAISAYLKLLVDGNQPTNGQIRVKNSAAAQFYGDTAKTIKVDLTAGSHTIKLQGWASQGNAAVDISPYWMAIVRPQGVS